VSADMTTSRDRYSEVVAALRENALLASCGHLLSWDEQTYMPQQGASHRAEQLALLAGLTHERSTSPRLGELLEHLAENEPAESGAAGPDARRAAVIREARRVYERSVKLPRRLVEELSRTATLAQQ